MPYCPKCGVEVDKKRKTCPLCHFIIPSVNEEEINEKKETFPQVENIYIEEFNKRKNIAFYTIEVILISILGIFMIISEIYNVSFMSYFITSTFALIFYVFFFFNYLKKNWNYFGIFITTILLTYTISRFTESSLWFFKFSLPIILITFIDILFIGFLYNKFKAKNTFVYNPVLFLIFISIISLGIDFIVSLAMNFNRLLSWSLIVCISTLPIALIMLGIHHKTSEKVKESLKKRFHI